MKVDSIKTVVETDFSPSISHQFSIGNTPFVMDILRGKMYNNAILAVCREYSSNALDSHKERGIPDVPITIKLPNSFDSTFQVSDNGVGISPERMSIFVQYGVSTKQSSNLEHGGFGVGCKSAYSYVSSFSITTTTLDKEFNGIKDAYVKRNYFAYIDDTRLGKIDLISEEISDIHKTGTTISIAVKNQDFYDFKQQIINVCQYWEVRPEIQGDSNFSWPAEKEVIFKGDDWKIYKKINNYSKPEQFILISGIPYPLNESFLNLDSKYKKILSLSFSLSFKIGELSVTANRESLDYSNAVVSKLENKLKEIYDSLEKLISDKINEEKCLYQANNSWLAIRGNFENVITHANWTDATGTVHSLKANGINLYSIGLKASYFHKKFDGSIKRENSGYLEFLPNTKILVNNEDRIIPDLSRLHTYFEKHPNVKKILIIDYKKPKYDYTVNTNGDKIPIDLSIKKKEAFEQLEKNCNYSLMNKENISLYEKKKIAKVVSNSPRNIIKGRKYGYNGSYIAEADGVDLKNGVGYYAIYDNRTIKVNSKVFPSNGFSFQNIGLPDIYMDQIYFFTTKQIKKLGTGWKTLESLIQEKIDEFKNSKLFIDNKEIFESNNFEQNETYAFKDIFRRKTTFLEDLYSELSKDTMVYKYLNICYSIFNNDSKVFNYIKLIKIIPQVYNNTSSAIYMEKILDDIYVEYPLLNSINIPYYPTKKFINDLAFYINRKS
jgi:hypothetical protein